MAAHAAELMGATADPCDPVDCRLALDRRNPTPLWFQVECFLAAAIVDQRIGHGEAIGTERQLMDRFAVSRSTIRKAVAALCQRGLISRHPIGVFAI